MSRSLVLCLVVFAVSSACVLLGPSDKDIAKVNAATRSDKFVKTASAWLCPTAKQAIARAGCEGGVEIRNNRKVTVIGTTPKDGVWRAAYWDARGEHQLFVAASALNEQPDTLELEAYELDVSRRYPEEARIPLAAVNVADLIAATYRNKVLVMRQRSPDMKNKVFADGVFSFRIPLPVTAGSRKFTLVQFELANTVFVDDFENGGHSYRCGPDYCDELVIVAELTGRTVGSIDELGGMQRLPIFAIRELGDRYGTYKAN